MIVERMQHYVFPISTVNPTGTIQEGLTLRTDLDAPFRLAGIAIWTNNVAGGAFDGQMLLRFARPDGQLVQRLVTSANAIASGNSYAGSPTPTGANPNQALITPVYPNIVYPPQSVISVDLQTLIPAVNAPSALIIFIGTKLYREGEIWAPGYPKKWTARPYLDALVVPNVSLVPGGPPVLNQPFTAQQDSDFVFQMGMYADSDAATGGLPMSLTDLGFKMRDWRQQGYSNDYVPISLLFPFLTAQMPGFVYPEIYLPSQQQLFFDFKYLW
jgi:hypothetical protein